VDDDAPGRAGARDPHRGARDRVRRRARRLDLHQAEPEEGTALSARLRIPGAATHRKADRHAASRALLTAVAGIHLLAAAPGSARELWRAGDAWLDASGTLREIAVVTRGTPIDDFVAGLGPACVDFPNCPAFAAVGETRVAQSLTRLRLRADARANPHWSAHLVVDNELLLGDLDTFESQLSREISPRTLVDAEVTTEDDHARYTLALYRGNVAFESRHFEAVVGRQRIPWGVGRLWNPIDRFNAIPPLAIQPDQSPGIDAIDARVLFTGFTHLEAVFAPGRSAEEHAYAARLQGVLANVDFGLVGGVFDQAPMVGLDLAANVGDAAARTEVVYTRPEDRYWPIGAPAPRPIEDFWQVVVSLDGVLDWGSGLYVLVEHLYNGNALGFGSGLAGPLLPFFQQTAFPPFVDTVSPTRFGGSRVVTRSSQLTGAQVGYDVRAEWRLDLLVIYDWDGESAVFFPALSWMPRDWVDVTLGVQTTVGPHLSEYGNVPTTGFLLADVHF
jgi:hypothetical protein